MRTLAFFLILIIQPLLGYGQTVVNHYQGDINFKDVVEIKGLIYTKADTSLVTGRVIRYNKKNVARKYILVLNGKPDNLGWIQIKDKVEMPKESGLGTLLAVPVHFMENNINYTKEDYNDINKTQNYLSRQNEEALKAYHDMEERNDIQNTLSNKTTNGPFTEYYEKGQIKIKGNYKGGRLDGEWKEYYENGKLKTSGHYLKNKRSGEWKFFDEMGNLIKTEIYN